MSVHELALQRTKYKHLTDDEWRWFLQQVEGRERTADKLPTFAAIDDWWYPVRLSCEQCSSELTARYKASLVESQKSKVERSFLDLTGGYGVDTFFISEHFAQTDYVEQNAELCRIAEHNFGIRSQVSGIKIHNTTAEEFLHPIVNRQLEYDLIFLDPARRDNHGDKVFRLADCTPNVVTLLPTLLAHGKQLLLKLSPMLDLTQAVKELSAVNWDIHIVAVKNEVKEVLLLSGGKGTITAIDLEKKNQAFVFTKEEEKNAPSSFPLSSFIFLYEPNAAILKAGAYKLVAARFGLQKLDVNTHLYASEELVPDFPGRVWAIKEIINHKLEIKNANVVCRNYPLTPEQVKKKFRIKDGGEHYIIGCRIAGQPTLWIGERIQ